MWCEKQLPGQQLSSFFLSTTSQARCWRNESTSAGHDGECSQCKRAAWSCPRATSENKHRNLLPRGAPQLPDLCGLMAAKNLLQQLQLWILIASVYLTLCSDRTSWEEPLNSSTSFLTHSQEISVTVITSTFLFEKKRQKPAALEGLCPPGAFMLVQVGRKAITTWSCDLWIHLNSFKSLSCSWEHYWIPL